MIFYHYMILLFIINDLLSGKGKVIDVKKCNDNLLAANVSEIKVSKECIVNLKVLNFSWKTTFLVVNNILFDVVLSANFVRQHNLILDLENNCCYFNFKPNTKVTICMEQEIDERVNHF